MDIKCEVVKCKRLTVHGRALCQSHGQLKFKYGTPTPDRTCVECGNVFQYISNSINGSPNIIRKNTSRFTGDDRFNSFANCEDCFTFKSRLPKQLRFVISQHGLTIHNFIELYKKEQGCCATCGFSAGKPYDWSNRSGLCIDHNHNCCYKSRGSSCGSCIRGLLCAPCNSMLGYYEEFRRFEIERFNRYLDRPNFNFKNPTRWMILNG